MVFGRLNLQLRAETLVMLGLQKSQHHQLMPYHRKSLLIRLQHQIRYLQHQTVYLQHQIRYLLLRIVIPYPPRQSINWLLKAESRVQNMRVLFVTPSVPFSTAGQAAASRFGHPCLDPPHRSNHRSLDLQIHLPFRLQTRLHIV